VEENGQVVQPAAALDAPRGVFVVTVDDKGRLKLPASILQYLESVGERRVFITTFDKAEARIYPLPVWRQAEKILQDPAEDLEEVALVAMNYGADVEVDAQGRATLPAPLRKLLQLEGDEVRLRCFQGRINILGSAEYARRLEAAEAVLPDKLPIVKRKGL